MPRDPFMPLTRDEQRFVIHYIREGSTPEVVHIAERLARLKKGEGAKIVKRKHVQEELQRRKVMVEFEENRLIAKDMVAKQAADKERDIVTLNKIETALDKVIALDAEKHGPVVLKAIELGLIHVGSIRDGNRVKIRTDDPLGQDGKNVTAPEGEEVRTIGFYESIFSSVKNDPAASAAPAALEPAPLMPESKPAGPPTIPVTVPAKPKPSAPPPPAKKEKPAPADVEIT